MGSSRRNRDNVNNVCSAAVGREDCEQYSKIFLFWYVRKGKGMCLICRSIGRGLEWLYQQVPPAGLT